jgi:hypothetical protein
MVDFVWELLFHVNAIQAIHRGILPTTRRGSTEFLNKSPHDKVKDKKRSFHLHFFGLGNVFVHPLIQSHLEQFNSHGSVISIV